MEREQPEPDTKDWTWVLEAPCPECGFEAAAVQVEDLAALLEDSTPRWLAALREEGVRQRPAPGVWSVLEYACHVRDVHRVFLARLHLMLTRERPTFENWDQDAAALESEYAAQEPGVVAAELEAAAAEIGAAYGALRPAQHPLTGLRSNGSAFTVESLGRYHLHDVVHHAHDIGWGGDAGAARATRAAYDAFAAPTSRPASSSCCAPRVTPPTCWTR